MKDFDKWVSDVIGKGMNFTPKEKDNIKENLKNTLIRWRMKGLIGKDELPSVDSDIIWEWKRDNDKTMIIKLVKRMNSTIVNYRRKVFGLKGGMVSEAHISHIVNELMKEGMPIFYPNRELIDKFFKGEPIE
jgi:hypothetical protein|tara:strand:- start:787 stop:1182 length:396 start_codon:yes stop_codon:yes gene_type:complete